MRASGLLANFLLLDLGGYTDVSSDVFGTSVYGHIFSYAWYFSKSQKEDN